MYHPCGEQMEDTMSSIYPYLHSGRTENHQPVIQREGLHGCIRRTSHAFSPSARYCLPDKWQRENALDTYEATFLERQATHTRARAHSLSLSLSFSLFTFLRLLRFFHRPCRLRTTHVWNATRSGKKLPMHPVYRCFLSFAEKFPPFLSFFHSCATYMLVERVKAISCYTITFA